MKKCERCHVSQKSSEFYKDTSRKDGLAPYCKACRRQDAQRRYEKDKDRIKARVRERRDANKLAIDLGRFKMSEEKYNDLLELQGGRCAICGLEETSTWEGATVRRLSVDHDHRCCFKKRDTCGKCNRGLLCSRCNITLGKVSDSIELLENMIGYLKKYDH